MMIKINKKASMQLSINAIVILVMAMAVLGIGLGLIRGVLAPAQGNLEDAIKKVDLSETATSSEQIANLPGTLKLKSNTDNQVAISFYNSGYSCTDTTFDIDCGGVDVINRPKDLPTTVDQGTAETLIAIFSPDADESGKIACEVIVNCDNNVNVTKSIFVSFNG